MMVLLSLSSCLWIVWLLTVLDLSVSQQQQQPVVISNTGNVIGNSNTQALEVRLEFEIRTEHPSNLLKEIDTDFANALIDSSNKQLLNNNDVATGTTTPIPTPTILVDEVQSKIIGDCIDSSLVEMTSVVSEECLLASMSIAVTLNRPKFNTMVAEQGIYDLAQVFFEQYTKMKVQSTGDESIHVRLSNPLPVHANCRIGFREFQPLIDQNERGVISDAFEATIRPLLSNAAPIYHVQFVSIIVQDVRDEMVSPQRQRQRQLQLQTKTTVHTDEPEVVVEEDLVLWTDLFIRGHCSITEESCNSIMFNQTLYNRLSRPDPNNNALTGMQVLLQNLQSLGQEANTDYFEGLSNVYLASSVDQFYYDLHNTTLIQEQQSWMHYQYRDPNDYTTSVPIWLWIFLVPSTLLLLVGIPYLYFYQLQQQQQQQQQQQLGGQREHHHHSHTKKHKHKKSTKHVTDGADDNVL